MSRKRRANVRYCESTDEEDTADPDFRMDYDDSVSQQTVEEATEVRKRGRGPSKRPCLNRNALMARENRLRKKAYLEKIESKLSFYEQENKTLTTTIQKQAIDIKRLSGEVAYLRSILNNNTSITALLRALNSALKKLHGSKSRCVSDSQPPVLQRVDCAEPRDSRLPYGDTKENVMTGSGISHLGDGIQFSKQDVHTFSTAYSANSTYSTTTTTTNVKRLSNYTSIADIKKEPFTREVTDILNSSDNAAINDYLKCSDYQNSMPITPMSTPDSDLKKDAEKADVNSEQLPLFSMDIFDDLPKCDDIMSPVDRLQDTESLLGEEDLFPNLEDAGICLHLNSDKVSLEFCSICCMNSKNSEIE